MKEGEKEMKKMMSLFLSVTFFMGQLAVGHAGYAATLDPQTITVPRNSGRIVETHISKNKNAPLVVYLQDIHVNYESQKAEAAVLESLIRDYGIDLVLVEGKQAGLEADFKYLRAKGPRQARVRAAEKLLRDGTIASVDYLDLTTEHDFLAYGVEDMNLYAQETKDHLAIFDAKTDCSQLVATLQNIASNLKLHIYTKEMRDLDEKIAAYDTDEIGLVEYVKHLQEAATANTIKVEGFSNVALFADSANLEDQISFVSVETERQAAIDAIEKVIKDSAKDEFLAKGIQFRTGDISQGEYYAYLTATAKTAKVDISEHKNLVNYTNYITTYEKINTNLLFKELDQLVDNVKTAMIKTPEQKQLSQIDKGLSIISGFVNTKLIPDEYNYLVKNKADFDLKGWVEFLKNNSAKYSLTSTVPSDISVLEKHIPVLERFYTLSFDRDNAFISNIKASLSKHNKDKAVFVAGGFHTPNMTKLLKENNFSYVVVAPKVDIIRNYEDIYLERAQIDMDYLTKNFSANGSAVVTPITSNRAAISAIQNEGVAQQVVDALNAELKAVEASQDQTRTQNLQGLADAVLKAAKAGQDNAAIWGLFNQFNVQIAPLETLMVQNSAGVWVPVGIFNPTDEPVAFAKNARGQVVSMQPGINIDTSVAGMDMLVKALPEVAAAIQAQPDVAAAIKQAKTRPARVALFRERMAGFIRLHEAAHEMGFNKRLVPDDATRERLCNSFAKAAMGIDLTAQESGDFETFLEDDKVFPGSVPQLDALTQVFKGTLKGNMVAVNARLQMEHIALNINNVNGLATMEILPEAEQMLASAELYGMTAPSADDVSALTAAIDAGDAAKVQSVIGAVAQDPLARAGLLLALSHRQMVTLESMLPEKGELGDVRAIVHQDVELNVNGMEALGVSEQERPVTLEKLADARRAHTTGTMAVEEKGQTGVRFLTSASLVKNVGSDKMDEYAKEAVGGKLAANSEVKEFTTGNIANLIEGARAKKQAVVVIGTVDDLKGIPAEALNGVIVLPPADRLDVSVTGEDGKAIPVAQTVLRTAVSMVGCQFLKDNGADLTTHPAAATVARSLNALGNKAPGDEGSLTADQINNLIPASTEEDATGRITIVIAIIRILPDATVENRNIILEILFASYA